MQSTAAMRSCGDKCCWVLLLLSARLLLLGSLVVQLPAAGGSGHVVTRMRGFDGPLPFYLETGYVEVDEQHGVQLFYYFVRSENDPDEDPLVLWLSGGPGCSGFSGFSGLAYEIGPLQFDAQGYRGGFPTLLYRPETWSKVSNIIFMDSPVGTGFSYATSEEGLESSDTMAVKQLLVFLRKWLQDHPQFLSNPLYIGGDSYGGMIVPGLALEIDRSIGLGEKTFFNLKGYISGNPVTDNQFDTDGVVPFLHGMGLISYELYKNALENCGGKYSDAGNAACAKVIQAIDDITSDVNQEHILEPACPDDEQLSPKTMAEIGGMSRLMLESVDSLSGFKCRKASYILSNIWGNDETIQENLGVRKGTIGAWNRCNLDDLLYNKNVQSVVSYHSTLAAKGYRALIYSGDHDRIVPFVGTQAWIRYLNLTIVDDWRPWYVGGQVAGFTRNSGNLTYTTVKGAGHTAPEYKTMECQTMFRKWISLDPL